MTSYFFKVTCSLRDSIGLLEDSCSFPNPPYIENFNFTILPSREAILEWIIEDSSNNFTLKFVETIIEWIDCEQNVFLTYGMKVDSVKFALSNPETVCCRLELRPQILKTISDLKCGLYFGHGGLPDDQFLRAKDQLYSYRLISAFRIYTNAPAALMLEILGMQKVENLGNSVDNGLVQYLHSGIYDNDDIQLALDETSELVDSQKEIIKSVSGEFEYSLALLFSPSMYSYDYVHLNESMISQIKNFHPEISLTLSIYLTDGQLS